MTFTMMEKDLDMTKTTVEEEVIIRIYTQGKYHIYISMSNRGTPSKRGTGG